MYEALCCPRCRGPLETVPPEPPRLRCFACEVTFPSVGGVPCLFGDPDHVVSRWRVRAAVFDHETTLGLAILQGLLQKPDMVEASRRRLERQLVGRRENRSRVLALLEGAGIERAPEPEPKLGPDDPPLMQYIEQIHRDWGWDAAGSDENRISFDLVSGALGDRALGHVVVLGAGACRLTWDLHVRRRAESTLAVDVNPFPLLVARAVIAHQPVTLFEVPTNPRDGEHVAVERRLETPPGAGEQPGLSFLFADAMQLPVRDGSVDTVVTPWFIDQVPADVRDVIAVAHRALRPGGTWLSFGPLIYRHDARFSSRYCVEEVLDLVSRCGFRVDASTYGPIPFLQSPATSHGRVDWVLTFVATKVDVDTRRTDPPVWLLASHVGVPRFPALETFVAPNPIFAWVVSQIDGTRTVDQIARLVSRHFKIPEGHAKDGVRACLGQVLAAGSTTSSP